LVEGLQEGETKDASKDRTFLQERLTRCHKSIHLALEVKTFFGNSTPVTGPSIESNTQKPGLPTDSCHQLCRKREGETCTQRVTKQSLSDYAHQDLPVVTKWLDF
jgi:hypothetical protein